MPKMKTRRAAAKRFTETGSVQEKQSIQEPHSRKEVPEEKEKLQKSSTGFQV